jgi:hypothetical protein
MNIILPLTITDAMIKSGTTIAEPASGETAWVASGTYAVGDLRIRATTHRVYACVQAHTGRAALPEVDSAYWLDAGPTQRFAPFDVYTTTAAKTTSSLTYVLQPGFFNALSFYGLVGASLAITVKDAPGGAVLYSRSVELFAQAAGLYELLFAPLRQINRIVLSEIPIGPTAELTITVTAATGQPVALGMVNVGDYRRLIGQAEWGGTEYGASADPKSYSYIRFFEDGSSLIKRRGSATDMRGTVVLPADEAAAAVDLVQLVLDVPVSCVATDAQGYDYLNVFGLISGSMTAAGPSHANFAFTVKGFL